MVRTLERSPTPVTAHVGITRSRAARRNRAIAVTSAVAVIAVGLFILTMMIGSYPLRAVEVVRSVLHLGSDPAVDFIVWDLRLPTAATALAVGMALGVAGLTFQKLLANPLASPDFVGVSSGASLFAVASILVVGGVGVAVSMMALIGALVGSLLVYVLAWRDGITGYRFILIGIGVSEFMLSLVGFLIARADLFGAREAMTWLVGSVGQAGRGELLALVASVAVLLPAALLLERSMRVLELGDDAATALGSRVEAARLSLIAVAVILVAFATAAAGPIMFVALIAGPVARRLLGPATSATLAAAFVGAIIVLMSDLIAVHALPYVLPTGLVTGAIGAPYLLWLLATTNRAGRGG